MRITASRLAAVVLPVALVLGSTGTAMAVRPKITPTPKLTSTPAKFTNVRSAKFVWTAAAGTTYSCNLDGAVTACTSPKTYAGPLTVRTHTFKLTAKHGTDRASSTSYSWTIDITAPVAPTVTRTAPATSPAASATATFTLSDSATDLASFTCSVDGSAFAACTSPKTVTGLGTGTHTFSAKAVDKAGNVSLAKAAPSWVVDLTPPAVPTVTAPDSPTNSTSASIPFTSDGTAASFTCSLDGGAAASCTSPWTTAGPLGDGDHTLSVVAVDGLGNASAAGTATWTVDLTPPAVPVLVTGPATTTSSLSYKVEFTETDDASAASFSCSLDGGPAAACTSPATGSVPAGNQSHTLAITAADSFGNTSLPLNVTWTVDTTSLPPTISSGPHSPTNATTADFSFAATDPSATGFECKLDGGSFGACTAPQSYSSLAAGAHTFTVHSLDGAVASPDVAYHWVVDTTPPAQPNTKGTPLVSGPANSVPTFVWTGDLGTASYLCTLSRNGGTPTAPVACSPGHTPVPTADGTYTLKIYPVDLAGNQGAPLVYTFVLDTTAPIATRSIPATLLAPIRVSFNEVVGGASGTTLRLAGTTSAVSTRKACLNGSNATIACTSGLVRAVVLTPVVNLVPGQKYVVVVPGVHDTAGNLAKITSTPFRALRAIQETNTAMAQSWASRSTSLALGGRYVVADRSGAAASYAFRGTAIVWYTATGPSMGTARVYVDRVLKATVNNYASAAHWRVARTVTHLTSGPHTLTIVATGLKGSRVGTGSHVVVDAVKVGATTTTNPALLTRWATVAASGALAGRYALADQAGDVVAMTFRGTAISWYTVTGVAMGRARVYIDGVLKGTFDDYAAATHYRVRHTWSLTDKVHTIKIVVLGTHRAAAKGSSVAADEFLVG